VRVRGISVVDLIAVIGLFDIHSYLDEIGVEYRESGKNIGNGSIGICCPLCGDDNFHMGVNIEKKFYNCWRCGDYDDNGRGSLFKLMYILEGLSGKEAYKKITKDHQIGSYQGDDIYEALKTLEERWASPENKEILKFNRKNKLNVEGRYKNLSELNPKLFTDKSFLSYIKKRDFTVDELNKWGVRAHISGKFAMRLVFPLYKDNEIVNYTGRDVVGNASLKYLHLSNDEAVMPIKSILYGLDYIKKDPDELVLVEGVLDAVRIGKGLAVASMGLVLSEKQKELLFLVNPKKLFIIFDYNAWIEAEKIKKELGVFIDNITVVRLPDGKDPADLKKSQLHNIFNEYNICEEERYGERKNKKIE
tara:strand:- start:42749 stop:43834 length:1086 start_codon:yes stop_codon:yes gene_type:complete